MDVRTCLAVLSVAVCCCAASAGGQAPQVVSVWPGQNEPAVPPSADITVTFDMDMDETTITSSSFVVNGKLTGRHPGVISYDGGTRTATFDPAADFDVGEEVMISVTPDIRSAGGAAMASGYVWVFTVKVNPVPGGYFVMGGEYAVNNYPTMACAADLDNDGDLDLAAVNYYSNSLSVLMNNGDGSFGAKQDYYTEGEPYDICAADLNADGYMDLAAAAPDQDNYTFDVIIVLLNHGDGTFPTRSNYGAGREPESVKAADLDGDGDLDLLTANVYLDGISILFNRGDGTFLSPVFVDVGMEANWMGDAIAVDVDGDGDLDLAAARGYCDSIAVVFNDGTGVFGSRIDYEAGNNPQSIVAADLDGDSYPELIAANFYGDDGDDVSIYYNDGDGTYGAQVLHRAGDLPWRVTAADVDGDADLDLVVANSRSDDVTILTNFGAGTVRTQRSYPAGDNPYSAFPADFDGDGDLDLAVTNGLRVAGTITILTNETCFDGDGDGYGDPDQPENVCPVDNCPYVFNPGQSDLDDDAIGDACDECTDTDGDGFGDPGFAANTCPDDNCPPVFNPDQADWNSDGIGDTCDFYSECNFYHKPGDANEDGSVNVGDAVYIIGYIFKKGPPPTPYPIYSGDANKDCSANIGDCIYIINHVFKGGPPEPTCIEWVDECGKPLR